MEKHDIKNDVTNVDLDLPEPYKIKVIEPIRLPTRAERQENLVKAGYNVFALRSEDVFIDLLSDSGTTAMSQEQWAGLMIGDEAYAGSRNFYHLHDAVRDIFGFEFLIPCHQGRGAENVLNMMLTSSNSIVPGNTHFDTTKAHIEHKEGKAIDCTANDETDVNFKGNVDLEKLEAVYKKYGKENIPFTVITATCNSNGGHPVSLKNMRAVKELSAKYGILVCLDGARFAENCYFIREREPGMEVYTIKEIAKLQAECFDIMLMSCKKDALVNIGGFLLFRDNELYKKAMVYAVLCEGFVTYGGLACRELEAMARGLYEVLEPAYLQHRIGQVRALATALRDAGICVAWPPGGHGVYVDTSHFLPHIPPHELPAVAFCSELYAEAGIRAVEIGTLLSGRDPQTGQHIHPEVEYARLAIPRRVYTASHMRYVAEAIKRLWQRRHHIQGMEIISEGPILRHFTATFKPIPRPQKSPSNGLVVSCTQAINRAPENDLKTP